MPISTDPIRMFNDHDIVLTTYHEVLSSFPLDEPPIEVVDPVERATWAKSNFEENKGLLHSLKYYRVVLDEAQVRGPSPYCLIRAYTDHSPCFCSKSRTINLVLPVHAGL